MQLALQEARYYHASHLQDVSRRQDIIMQVTCKMYLVLRKARYYQASYLQDNLILEYVLLVSCKSLVRKQIT